MLLQDHILNNHMHEFCFAICKQHENYCIIYDQLYRIEPKRIVQKANWSVLTYSNLQATLSGQAWRTWSHAPDFILTVESTRLGGHSYN